MSKPLEKEFKYYVAHQAELVSKHKGKWIVIKSHEVIGVYDDEPSAIRETQKNHKLGTFLVQLVEPGAESYTRTFHSRVAFS